MDLVSFNTFFSHPNIRQEVIISLEVMIDSHGFYVRDREVRNQVNHANVGGDLEDSSVEY